MEVGHLITGILILLYLISGYKTIFKRRKHDIPDGFYIIFVAFNIVIVIIGAVAIGFNWNTKLF